ncbi:putative chitin binding protein [Fusarium bulbicola]|nr:putative chitin binding protein [Fusarium bulbicola]
MPAAERGLGRNARKSIYTEVVFSSTHATKPTQVMSSLQPAHKGILILFGIALVFFYFSGSSDYGSSVTLSQRTKVYRRCVTPRTIALTYDDNPDDGIYDLLALLKSYNATATFFPNAPHHYNTVKLDKYVHAAHTAGHQIGIHTWDHINLDDAGHDKALEDIEKMNTWLYDVIGSRSNFVRPPYGACEMDCRMTLTSNGYSIVQWNMDTLDWIFGTDDKYQSTIELIKSWVGNQPDIDKDDYAGPIVLMHSRHHTSATVVTQHLLDLFTSKGFDFVSISDCLGIDKE